MLQKIVSFTEELIKIPSDPDNAKALEKILDFALEPLQNFTIERFEKNGTKSALVYNTATRPEKFEILFNCHLDIIPGKPFQYIPHQKDNRLYGVGAMDMKANAACTIFAFQEVAKNLNFPVAIQLVTDEEIGGFLGTKYQVEQGVKANFVIATEPTNFNIVHKAKGVLWLKIFCTGKTAHGAYPWRGENAIWKMQKFLTELQKKFPVMTEEKWKTSLNVSSIESSNKTLNKIPDDCSISLDIRFIPEDQKNIIETIQRILPDDFFMEILANESALFVSEENVFLQELKSITEKKLDQKIVCYGAQGTSDARHFAAAGMNGIEFGPVGDGIGTDNEWVDIPSLEKYFEILKNFLQNHKVIDTFKIMNILLT